VPLAVRAEGTNLVLLDPDVAAVFPDATTVNEALRALAVDKPIFNEPGTRGSPKTTARLTRRPDAPQDAN